VSTGVRQPLLEDEIPCHSSESLPESTPGVGRVFLQRQRLQNVERSKIMVAHDAGDRTSLEIHWIKIDLA